jgi:AraC family transcriptional regulator, regulatory protein of adaptative response / DNA-3-methyladenine glycosylase II
MDPTTAIDADIAYRALSARDARFDGRLFVGVTSTGIYCRPICRVRTPRRENCRFFETPAQAESAAFRPCLKCRPEIAPGPGLPWSVMDASSTLAHQAAQWLDAHAFDDDSAAASPAHLAAHLGVSARHLRRIFGAAHGVSPLQYVQTRRLLLAKQLLTDTDLSVTRIAHASGFRSLRRFNAAFAESYRLSPRRLRTAGAAAARTSQGVLQATLAFREPFAREGLLRFLGRRAIPGVEVVDEALRVRRTVRAGLLGANHEAGWVEIVFAPGRAQLHLRASDALAPVMGRLLAAVRRWLDLDAEPDVIANALQGIGDVDAGFRLPGGLDAFELAVRAILGQQVTVAAARTLARRLVERFGTPLATPWDDLDRCFPPPSALASLDLPAIAELGIIRSRAAALIAVAADWQELEPLLRPGANAAPFVDRIQAVPGIGAWTAHYIAMRALGWTDAFPPGDVAVLNALALPRGTRGERDADGRAQAWRPWRSYAVLALWNSLENPS